LAIASRSNVLVGVGSRNGRVRASADAELRSALARELHDRVAQTLTTIVMDLEVFKRDQAGQEVLSKVDAVQGSMREVLSSLRELLHDLRAESTGFAEDLEERLSALVEAFQRRTGITSVLVVEPGWPARSKSAAGLNLYRIAEEALVNAGRHSGARRVSITLRPLPDDGLRMTITDYGRGFDGALIAPGIGTIGMKERAVLIGALLTIDSAPGAGTSVHVTLPRPALAADRA
jgi:two-component system, NarL family, sensor histidine kinase UhpB